jgi:acyl-CoA thioesterase-1
LAGALLALALLSPGTPCAATPAGATILVVGDSLSAAYGMRVEQGWVTLLQQRLKAQGYGHKVVNASSSGETTGGALARLPRALELHQPAIVIVELGGNDALRGLPVSEVRGNFERIFALSEATGARLLLVAMRIPPNYGPRYTGEFESLYGDLARKHALPLVPFFLDRIALDERLMQDDGIHPTAAAQPQMLDAVWPVLKPLLGKPR